MNIAAQSPYPYAIRFPKERPGKLVLPDLKLKMFSLTVLLILLIVPILLYPPVVGGQRYVLQVSVGKGSLYMLHKLILSAYEDLVLEPAA